MDVLSSPNAAARIEDGTDLKTRRRKGCVGAMVLMRSIGDVAAVGRWLQHPKVLAAEVHLTECRDRIASCRAWIVTAEEFENAHGHGSLLDQEHPFWANKLEPALARFRDRALARPTSDHATPKDRAIAQGDGTPGGAYPSRATFSATA